MNKIDEHHGPDHQAETTEYPNETIRLLLERGSCRRFEDKPVPDEILNMVLDAGVHAPTGGNLQPYSIIKIRDKETNLQLAEMCGQKFIGNAPVNLIFCIDWHRAKRWAELENAPFTAHQAFAHFWISFQDTIIAAQNICTAADAMGLGSVYIGSIMVYFKELAEMCKLPEHVLPVVLLPMGYPKSKPAVRNKLGREMVVHDEVYHDPEDQALLDAMNIKYDNLTFEATQEKIQVFSQTCEEVYGEEFTQEALEQIKDRGFISNVQRYFGLHYKANEMPTINVEMMQDIEKRGFEWFREWQAEVNRKAYQESRKSGGEG